MAELNIKIDSTQAVTGAKQIEGALDKLSLAAWKAGKNIEKLEMMMGKGFSAVNGSFRSSLRTVEEFDTAVTRSSRSLSQVSRGFDDIHRSSATSIGSITKFFGQMALGVFLVGELVMIFTALSTIIKNIGVGSYEFSDAWGRAGAEVKTIIASIYKTIETDLIKNLNKLADWFKDNREPILQFFMVIYRTVQGLGDIISSVYHYFNVLVQFVKGNFSGAVEEANRGMGALKALWDRTIKDMNTNFGITIDERDPSAPKDLMKAYEDIFKETGILADDYYSKLKFKETERHRDALNMMGKEKGFKDAIHAENLNHASKMIEIEEKKYARQLKIFDAAQKVTKVMGIDQYNILVSKENNLHKAIMLRAKTEGEVNAENARHLEVMMTLYEKLTNSVRHYIGTMEDFFGEKNWRNSAFSFLYDEDPIEKNLYLKVFYIGGEKDPIKMLFDLKEKDEHRPFVIQLKVDLIDPEKFYKFTEDYKQIVLLDDLFSGKITRENFMTEWFKEADSAIKDALDASGLLVDQINELDNAYSAYVSGTGRMTLDMYKREIEQNKARVDSYKDAGLAIEEARVLLEKLNRQSSIKFLEGQDSLVGGFYAGLMRLKDEIEPWGKIMSDAVVNAAHDMYNAMDDFFFNALEGRMDSFLEYFEGAMSGIRKMMAGYLTENVKKGLGGILPSAAQMVGGQIQQGGGQTGFSMGGFSNVPQTGFWSKPIFSGAKSRGGVGDDPMAQSRMTLGQGAGALLMGGATAYSIYQQSQGMSPGKAATSGALTGAMGGAAIGAMFGGVGAIVGAVAGAVMGGVSGYLMGEQQDKAKLEVATGAGVDKAYGSTRTPFGLFGFETAENVTNAGQYKGTFEKVKEATESLAEMMTDAQVSAIREYFEAGWDSSRIKGDMDPKEIEGLFKEYFAEIGEVWGTSFGAWMQDFDGTLDELFESIKSHVEAVVFIQDTLNPKNLTEYDSEVNTFNENVDRMRYNLEETGGTIEELNQIEQARIKGLQDLKQVYIDSFESLKMQMAGMSDQNVSLVMWAKQFNTTAPDVISNWESIEAVIMSWDFDTFNDKAKASGMTLAEFTDMILAFDNAAASTAAMLYDINIQSAQAAGVISDFDATIMGINKQFDDWIFQTKDLAGATEYATILEERRTKAIEKATQALEASYYSALAGLPGLSTGKNKQFATSAIASKYGLSGSDITSGTVKNLYNSAVSGGFSYDQVRQYMDSFGWENISVSEFVSDIGTLHEIYFPKLEDAASGASDALDKMRSEMESLLKSIQNTIIGIDDLIWELTGGQYAPVQSMEGFKNQYAKLFGGIAGSDDPYAAFGDFKSFIPGMVDFMGAFGGYKDWNASVIEDLMGLKDTLKEREEAINIQLQVTVQVERRAISRTVTDAIVVNEGGITNVLAEKIGDILNLRLTRRT